MNLLLTAEPFNSTVIQLRAPFDEAQQHHLFHVGA